MLEHTQKERLQPNVYSLNFIFSPNFLNHFYSRSLMATGSKNFDKILGRGKELLIKRYVGGGRR